VNIFDILIVQPIFNLLVVLYSFIPGGDFGISIIAFTIIFRLAMWPLVKRQLHQVKAMRKLQPELEKIKQRTKGNKQQYSIQMMELYKERGVSPFRSIGILLIQLPIFFALYRVIQIFTLHRDEVAKYTYDILENLAPIKQLIEHPDQFNEKLLGFVNLTGHAVGQNGVDVVLLLLAVIAAGTQFIMSRQTTPHQESKKGLRQIMAEAADGKQADQSEINTVVMTKMTKVLPFFMFLIMINLPGALALYYSVSNLVAVVQQHYILKQDEEELEEIASEKPKPQGKKATAKARAKAANEATVTRIVAKDTKKGGRS
jgi:YidC/Oxa1 family membrane protein insertase